MLGIVSGTVSLLKKDFLKDTEEVEIINDFGHALVMKSRSFAFIPRHGNNPESHILPHRINHRANMKALQDLGVSEVIGVNSTGSLSSHVTPGSVVIPDDFIMLNQYVSVYDGRRMHITPSLSSTVRRQCLEAASESGIEGLIEGGVYWQTTGPRLETKAEIRMMSRFADIVGMTMASEAIAANELGLPYAAICSVDNYAHGVVEQELNMKDITNNAAEAVEKIFLILCRYMNKF